MKKIFTLTLSCIFLLQNFSFAQVVYPAKQDVKDIYNKVNDRARSSKTLKEMIGNQNVTPLLATAVLAGGIRIESKEHLASLLEHFDINAFAGDHILKLYTETAKRYDEYCISDELLLNHFDVVYDKSEKFIIEAVKKEPNIIEYYTAYLQAQTNELVNKEMQQAGIKYFPDLFLGENVESARIIFENACVRSNINKTEFINAYNNLNQLVYMAESVVEEERNLLQLTRQLSVERGRYLTLSDFQFVKNQNDLDKLIERYSKNYLEAEKTYFEGVKKGEILYKHSQINPTLATESARFQTKIAKWELEFLRWNSQNTTLKRLLSGEPVKRFAKNGGLFVAVLGLFALAEEWLKTISMDKYLNNRANAQMDLQLAVDDNIGNLYAFLETLPENQKDTVFNYISEDGNYFTEFAKQTRQMLLTLAILDNKENNSKDALQQVDKQFDILYRNTEQTVQQKALNM